VRFAGGGWGECLRGRRSPPSRADTGVCPDENAKTRFLRQLKVVFVVD